MMKTVSLIALCLIVLLSAQAMAAKTCCPRASTCPMKGCQMASCPLMGTGPAQDNTLTASEKAAGWQLLFDGKTFNGWGFTENTGAWTVDKGTMHFVPKGGPYAYTQQTYGNFEFQTDFRVAKNTNSGIFFRWADLGDPVQTGFEMQVLDCAGKANPDKHDCGALYDAKAPSSNEMRPAMEWNTANIKCVNSWVTISLNGKTVVSADLNNWTTAHQNPDGTPNKYNVALKDWARSGHIGFQAHGCEVWYKNVKIRTL